MRLNKRQNGRLSDDKVAGNNCGHPAWVGKLYTVPWQFSLYHLECKGTTENIDIKHRGTWLIN